MVQSNNSAVRRCQARLISTAAIDAIEPIGLITACPRSGIGIGSEV